MQAKKSLPALATALLLALPLTPALAQSGSALQRVEVQNQTQPRTDVTQACPKAQQTLEDGMARALNNDMLPGSYRVEFQLEGDRVNSVRLQRTPLEYRRPLRTAVYALDCNDAAARTSPQRFAFILDVVAEATPRDTALAGASKPRYSLGLRAAD